MKIRFNNKQKELGDKALSRATAKIENAFSKFDSQVISVEVAARDINGTRGGVDKECRLLVRLRKMDDVFVTVREESIFKAIDSAISRAERSVKRKMRRRNVSGTGRSSKFGFAIYGNPRAGRAFS